MGQKFLAQTIDCPTKPFLIMGIVNVTPDSFSDAGLFFDKQAAINHIHKLFEDGADIVDLGAESTRPNALSISEDEEWQRLAPVLREIQNSSLKDLAISIDTYKPSIMLKALDFGVKLINNPKGICSKDILERIRSSHCGYLSMHMWQEPSQMQKNPLGTSAAIQAVTLFFKESHDKLMEAGYKPEQFWLDPGIGFGKTDAANIQLLQSIPVWAKRYPVAIGISRKSFLGRILDIPKPEHRDNASKMLEFGLTLSGAGLIRTHEVRTLASIRSLMSIIE